MAAPALIIETYAIPASTIARLLFPGQTPIEIHSPVIPTAPLYSTRHHLSSPIAQYFSRLFFISEKILIGIDKKTRTIHRYDMHTGKPLKAPSKPVTAYEEERVPLNTHLPHLAAQEGEVVLFPEEESED